MDKSNIRKYKDNKNKKMKYWKKVCPYINVKEEQYEEFSNNYLKIKKVIDILDFINELDIDYEMLKEYKNNCNKDLDIKAEQQGQVELDDEDKN